jgi:hypothetical protein
MSDTDIYKSHEPAQNGVVNPRSRKGRRRRSSSHSTFDETGERRRRSKNSGIRRLLHLSRKSSNEKSFWWGLLGITVAVLLVIAVWQFLYLEHVARDEAHMDEQYVPIRTSESAVE